MSSYKNLTRRLVFCLLSAISLLLLTTTLSAQKPPEIAAIQAKMERGETLTPDEQKKYDDYLKSLSDKLDQAMEKLKNIKPKTVDITKPVSLPDDETLPKLNPGAHYADAQAPTLTEYLALVKKYNDATGAKLTDIKQKLDEDLAQVKSANALSNLGMMTFMGESADRDESATALYEVTKGAAKDPKDGNVANNFGVLLKNVGEYQDSLKVLLYAEKQMPQYAVVQTNLGWTIAYLGDFFTAKTRFQKAINFNAYDSKAYEGMGLLFRVEGNVPEASKYLRMCLKNGFSAVAANNLMLVEGKVDGVIASSPDNLEADSTNGMKLSDVLVFPYQDNQTGQTSTDAKLQFADTPDFFSVSIKRVSEANIRNEFRDFEYAKKDEFKAALEALYQAEKQLDPIRPAPIQTGDTTVYPRSYELEVFALVDMEHVFARRHLLRFAKVNKHFQNEIHLPVSDKFFALETAFENEYKQCNRDEACQDAAKRKICRARVENIKGVNGSFQTLWTRYVQEERADLKRYYELAAPWIREIKNEKLNRYMNQRREFFIKAADPLEELGFWGNWEADVINNWSDDCGQDPTPVSTGNNLRGLKVFPEPYGSCHVPQYKFSGGIGILSAATEATCDYLKFEFSAFGVYGGFDRKFGGKESDDVTGFHFGLGFKEGFSNSAGGVNAVAKVGYYTSFRDGEMIDHGVEGVAKIDGGIGNANTGTVKDQIIKLETVQISAESGPRSDGSSPIKFASAFDDL
jgi:tetratricopeptide (TPR) repeat protein